MRARPRRLDGGQATVELALALPFVAVLLLAVVQVLLVAHAQALVEHAAREAARAAAVGDDAGALGPQGTITLRQLDGGLVEATVRQRFATDVPLVGALVADLDLVGRATFRQEAAVPAAPG